MSPEGITRAGMLPVNCQEIYLEAGEFHGEVSTVTGVQERGSGAAAAAAAHTGSLRVLSGDSMRSVSPCPWMPLYPGTGGDRESASYTGT